MNSKNAGALPDIMKQEKVCKNGVFLKWIAMLNKQ